MPGASFAGVIRDSGLVSEGDRGLVMISGGADSVALLTGLVDVLGAGNLIARHVNYGLRPEAGSDQELVTSLCENLGVECQVLRPERGEGNLQAWAREVRHSEAERIRDQRDLDWIAIGHNRSDQAETFVYRLASSPGVRPLLAMPPRSGWIVRPLLSLDRDEIRSMLEGRFRFAEDESNQDPVYARNRIRLELMPGLARINSEAELNITRTRAELEQDEEALSRIAAAALPQDRNELADGVPVALLAGEQPAVGRRMIRQVAEAMLGRPVAVTPELAAEVIRLGRKGEGGRLDLGGRASVLVEAGRFSIEDGEGRKSTPEPVRIDVGAGITRFGEWEIESSRTDEEQARLEFGNVWTAFLDVGDRQPELRCWREGDRVEPLGMTGRKKLQDVFTDALVPASRRGAWPVLVVEETVVWVPGLVRSKHLLIGGPKSPVLRLQATPPFPI